MLTNIKRKKKKLRKKRIFPKTIIWLSTLAAHDIKYLSFPFLLMFESYIYIVLIINIKTFHLLLQWQINKTKLYEVTLLKKMLKISILILCSLLRLKKNIIYLNILDIFILIMFRFFL